MHILTLITATLSKQVITGPTKYKSCWMLKGTREEHSTGREVRWQHVIVVWWSMKGVFFKIFQWFTSKDEKKISNFTAHNMWYWSSRTHHDPKAQMIAFCFDVGLSASWLFWNYGCKALNMKVLVVLFRYCIFAVDVQHHINIVAYCMWLKPVLLTVL